jgi:hypothetical protein
MRNHWGVCVSLAVTLAGVSVGESLAQTPPIVFVDQGSTWTAVKRFDFYSQDQGSSMIPLDWLANLKQPNGQPFLGDSLSRYGYLPNPQNTNGLPVGFTASGPAGSQVAGMTCAACHTRQITVAGAPYRIDGGPAIVDFQAYLSDLDVAVANILASDASFARFAAAVLHSSTPAPEDVAALRQSVNAWYLRFHTLTTLALPKPPTPAWGPSRLDAVGMIFNRLTGLDIGQPPSFLIPNNIKMADAPVRYPFLWNAARQDRTQWAGFAENGNDLLGLARNLGEVYGVFAVFQPTVDPFYTNFLNNNSANFDGLGKLEDLIKLIGPPLWPWSIDPNLAARGETIYNRKGSCADCHGIQTGEMRSLTAETWKTPVQNVKTDTRQYDILSWMVSTGVLKGTFIPFATDPLKPTDSAFNVLATSVLGSIAEHALSGGGMTMAANPAVTQTAGTLTPRQLPGRLPPSLRELEGAFQPPSAPSGVAQPAQAARPQLNQLGAQATFPAGSYESRVLQGIWAAAPYLHNGSVPSLAELLKHPKDRVTKFKIGPAYDIATVGLAADQTQFNYELTTGCPDPTNPNSGNSNCGHDFGGDLSDDDKKALLEYLKLL